MRRSYEGVVTFQKLENTVLPLPGFKPWFSLIACWSLDGHTPPKPIKYFEDIKGAAQFCNASEKTIRRAIREGNLKTYSPGNKLIRFRTTDLLEWMGA